jgi:GNAT superfamily N-acetyltransferase
MAIIIRKACDADFETVMTLYRELAGVYHLEESAAKQHDSKRWQEVCNDTRQHLLVAEQDGVVIGTLNLTVIPNLGHGGQPWAAIDNVVVAPNHRGQGIGEAMLAEAGKIASEDRCYKIILSSNLARERAHEFYRKLGWKQSHIGFSLEL